MVPIPAGTLPNAIYRQEFFHALMAEAPASLLDVGCGDGLLIKAAIERGCKALGLDTDAAAIAKLRAHGIAAESGRAEALPFADASFELVVFSFTTHHLADLGRSLREALRVASRAVMVLEAWYDTAIPSQRVAEAYDLWSKSIDRRLGMVHDPVPSAAEIMDLLAGRPDIDRFDHAHRLVLSPWPLEEVRKSADAQLSALGQRDPELEQELARILEDAARHGISRDGALMMRIAKKL